MGMTAAFKLLQVARNLQAVLVIEAMCAAQAIDLLAPLSPGRGVQVASGLVREHAAPLVQDRYLAPEIEAVSRAVE